MTRGPSFLGSPILGTKTACCFDGRIDLDPDREEANIHSGGAPQGVLFVSCAALSVPGLWAKIANGVTELIVNALFDSREPVESVVERLCSAADQENGGKV